ncbi:MAG: hypothetical protein JW734_07485 [Candidatus Omnitrophica bacterium]|nr:hypothetical protein [Candidatus Omnitrophota bacterium]
MESVRKITCPECEAEFESENLPAIGSTLRCPLCTIDLKIIGLKPLTIAIDNYWEESDFNLNLKKSKLDSTRKIPKKEVLW